MSWATKFMFDEKTPRMVDGTGVQADPRIIAMVRAKQDAARAALGAKWICHPTNRVHRKTIGEQPDLQPNVVQLRRKV